MKKKLIIIILLFIKIPSYCQYLTQSAEGKSTIPLPLNGIGIGIDITKTEVAFGLNNYAQVLKGKNKLLLGLNLSAKSSDGLANLFNTGDIVPEGNFIGFLGASFSNNSKILDLFNSSKANILRDQHVQTNNRLFDDLLEHTKMSVITSSEEIANDSLRNDIVKELFISISSADINSLRTLIKDYKKDDPELAKFKESLIKNLLNMNLHLKKLLMRKRHHLLKHILLHSMNIMKNKYQKGLLSF